MDNEKLISKIFFDIQKDPSNIQAYEDVFSLCRNIEEVDFKLDYQSDTTPRVHISKGNGKSIYHKSKKICKNTRLS